MRELKIGEEIHIKCVETPDATCKGCIFYPCGGSLLSWCSDEYRADGKIVHFEIVEE